MRIRREERAVRFGSLLFVYWISEVSHDVDQIYTCTINALKF